MNQLNPLNLISGGREYAKVSELIRDSIPT
jgi:hypothetical protein